jgi:WD40 repeat protein
VSHDFSIGIHDGVTGDYIVTLEPFASSVLDTDFSRSGDLLVASSDDSSVKVWDTEDFELLTSYVAAPGGLQALELLPDDSTLVASDLSGRLIVMDIMSGEILEVIAELGSRTSAIALSDDGGVVAAPFGDGTVGLWSTTSGEQLTTLTGHSGVVTDLDFGPDDDWLVTASRDGTIRKWDLDTTSS